MASLDISIPHNLSQADAMKRIKGLLEKVKREHSDKIGDLREQWTDNVGTFSLSAMGFSVAGTVTVTPTHVQLSGDLPFAASFFKSRIETTIRERATELLA
jgi:hypothetical protein